MSSTVYVTIDPTVAPGEQRTEKQKQIDEQVLARVKYGIGMLQEKFGPDWVEHIDLKSLDLRDGEACVLGQVYASKLTAMERENGVNGYEVGLCDLDCGYDDGASGGFCLDEGDDSLTGEAAWERLQETWEHVLTPLVSKK